MIELVIAQHEVGATISHMRRACGREGTITTTQCFIALGTLLDRLPALNDRHLTELLQVLQRMQEDATVNRYDHGHARKVCVADSIKL